MGALCCTIGVVGIGFDAASAPKSPQFILIGTAVVLPAIQGYTIFVYRVFRGKVAPLHYG